MTIFARLVVAGALLCCGGIARAQSPKFDSLQIINISDTSYSVFGNLGLLVATPGNKSSILGYIYNGLPPNAPNLGAGINGYCKEASAGSQCFGVYGVAELTAARGVAVAAEFTSRNTCGTPDVNLPPNEGIGTPSCVANALQVTAGGTYASSLGMVIGKEGGSSVAFNTAVLIKDYDQYGIFIKSQPSGSQTPVVVQGNGNGLAMQIQTTGTMTPANAVIGVYDSGGVARFSVRQNGDIYGNALNAVGGAVVSGGYLSTNWNASGTLPAALAGVSIGWNYLGSPAEVDYFNNNATGGGHVFFQRGASTATRLMDIGSTGNVKAYGELGAAGYVQSSANSAGAYPATGQNVAIGWNFTSGGAEADWWNSNNAGGGHVFYQRTGTSASTRLMDISAAGNVKAYGGIDGTAIGGTTPAAGAFTTVTAGAGSFTTVTASSTIKNTGTSHRVMSIATATAAGVVQGTATALAAELTNVNAGSGGVILVDLGVGTGLTFTVVNSTGSAVNVYPPSGATISGLALNAAYSLASNTIKTFYFFVAGGWAVQ